MSTISTNVMDLAGTVQGLARAAESEAERGLLAAQENIAGMRETLGEVDRAARDTRELILAADQIRGIIGSITEIAQQTNLLALNASIEAAHAGAHGRGFAVVAGEVAKLAERTAKDAGDITRVITALSQRVDQAMATMEGVVAQVRRAEGKTQATAQVLERMVSQVRETASANLRIAEVAQVQVDRMTTMRSELDPLFALIQESRAKGETTAAISQDLTRVTEEFTELMGRFTLDLKPSRRL
jgi:methyl-accepting chemotaxis protein